MGQIIQIQDIMENKISLDEARSMVIMYQGEIFTYFDEGSTRYVFKNDDKTKVIKLLKTDIGKDYNKDEAEIYHNATDQQKNEMAVTKLVGGFIEQEFVEPIKFAGKKLTMEQIRFANSCRKEVGWTKDGRLVCFDLDDYNNMN